MSPINFDHGWHSFKEIHSIKSDYIYDKLGMIKRIGGADFFGSTIPTNEVPYYYPFALFPYSFIKKLDRDFSVSNDISDQPTPDYICIDEFLPNLNDCLYNDWKYLKRPTLPQKPRREKAEKYFSKFSQVQTNSRLITFLISFVITFCITLFLYLRGSTLVFAIISSVFISVGISLCISFLCFVPKFKHCEKKIPNPDYEAEQSMYDTEYEMELEKYNKACANYLSDIENFRSQYIEFIENQKEEALVSILKRCIKQSSPFVRDNNSTPRSEAENALFYQLMKVMPDNIFIDMKMGNYKIDLAIKTNNGVCIDLEIDEPYEYDTKREQHCIDGEDEERNNYFRKNDWFVIRFSEKQALKYTDECTKIITIIKNLIEKGDISQIDSYFELANKISDPRWTIEQANIMALEDYRNSYSL